MRKFKNLLLKKSPTINFLITVLIIVLYLGLFFRPTAKKLFLNLTEAPQLKTEIINTEQEWANIDSFKEKISRLNKKIDYYEKKLPSEKEIPAILEYLSNSAKKMNVRITEIKPIEQGEDKKQIYYNVPILVKAECGYHQLGRFLNQLESADRFMKISNINIVVNPRKANIHDVQLIVGTYVMER